MRENDLWRRLLDRFTLFHKLPLTTRPTYYYDLRASLLNSLFLVAFTFVEFVAAENLGATPMQLAMLGPLKGVGMVLSFYWGFRVRQRPKMPYVFWPRFLGHAAFFMIAFVRTPMELIVVAGISSILRQTANPAWASIRRTNYPATLRGTILGFIMARHATVGLAAAALVGWHLTRHPDSFRVLLPALALFGVASDFVLGRIYVRGEKEFAGTKQEPFRPLAAAGLVWRNARFRRYLGGFFIFGFANLMLGPVIPVFLKEHKANYLHWALIMTVVPDAVRIVTVQSWGRVLDRTNPVLLRALFCLGWTIEPVGIAACLFFPAALPWIISIYIVLRLLRSFFAGGAALLGPLGAMYFARKEDVALYQGAHTMLLGLRQFTAPFLGAGLAMRYGPHLVFGVSAAGMLIGASLLLLQAFRERRNGHFMTFREAEETIEAGGEMAPGAEEFRG